MRHGFALIMLMGTLATAFAQSAQDQKSPSGGSLTGRWILTGDYLGTTLNSTMELEQKADKLTGNFDGDKLQGSVTGNSLHFLAKDDQGGSEEGTATVTGDTMTGTVTFVDGSNPSHPVTIPFTAKLAAPYHPTGAPKTHEFTPRVFYRQFSPFNKPVLTVNPGDTIHTTTVDAGGNDEKGVPRVLGGNPKPGPSTSNRHSLAIPSWCTSSAYA
jgi:amidase